MGILEGCMKRDIKFKSVRIDEELPSNNDFERSNAVLPVSFPSEGDPETTSQKRKRKIMKPEMFPSISRKLQRTTTHPSQCTDLLTKRLRKMCYARKSEPGVKVKKVVCGRKIRTRVNVAVAMRIILKKIYHFRRL